MTELHFWPIVQCLILLTLANGVPVIAKKMLGEWFAWPIDGGWLFWDGQPLLGRSKTFRGFVLAILAAALGGLLWWGSTCKLECSLASPPWSATCCRASSNVACDLAPSAEAPGFDQVPESLLPFLAVKNLVGLSVWDILIGVGAFWIGELMVSRLLYMLRIRDRPY